MLLFVPYVPPTQTLTPRARELSDRVGQAVEEFRRYYPDTSDADVRAALAAAGTSYRPSRRAGAVAALLAGLAAMGVIFLVGNSEGAVGPGFWIVLMGVAALLAVALTRGLRSG